VAEGARLESVFRGNSNVGSNPTLSARFYYLDLKNLTAYGSDAAVSSQLLVGQAAAPGRQAVACLNECRPNEPMALASSS
jgi:hypothetical protein